MLFNSVRVPQFSDCWLISVTRENIKVFSFAFSYHWQLGQIIEFGDHTLTILPENHIDKFHWHLFLFYVIYFFFLDLGKIFILDIIFSTSKCVSLFKGSTVKPLKLEVFFSFQGDFLQYVFLKLVLLRWFWLLPHLLPLCISHIYCVRASSSCFFLLIIFSYLFSPSEYWVIVPSSFMFTLIVSKLDWYSKSFQRIFINTDFLASPKAH